MSSVKGTLTRGNAGGEPGRDFAEVQALQVQEPVLQVLQV